MLRQDKNGGILNDFDYQYYSGTNRLKRVEELKEPGGQYLTEITYYDTPLTPDGNYYERINVEGAEVPPNHTAELKATQHVLLKDGFMAAAGSNFTASIIAPGDIPAPDVDTNYIYDEIGNLIADKNEGIDKINWTANGKIRSVIKKDGTIISFKYDGAGNRIQKWAGDIGGSVVYHYVRDASGNVMAIYKKEELMEQPIYGSSRLGVYNGGRRHAHRTLGSKTYELSNHLGNVLAVVTDNINMSADGATATIVSTSDYYPFGLGMEGRSWDNDEFKYRYGFNGKEKTLKEWAGEALPMITGSGSIIRV
ncbi:MAG: hypothetical protein M3421_10170 [Bacteroidota bacterium]|nr:hypothetical protein [Bacteroidota bacterium]